MCFAPFGPPFNHEVPPRGERYNGDLCEYPDVLKELAYIIYKNERVRAAVFAKLGHADPSTLALYWRFIGKISPGGLLGVYEVLAAYLELKESNQLTV